MLNKIIQSLGHEAVSTTERRITYKSPFNPDERTASFYTFSGANGTNWKDYASGEGGDTFKFLMLYFGITFPEAKIKTLELSAVTPNMAMKYQKSNAPGTSQNNSHSSFNQQKSYEIKKVQPIQNKALTSYLCKRGISEDTAKRANLEEVYYTIKDKDEPTKEKRYFAIAFKNDKEGLEVRNAYFKANLKAKAITSVINGSKQLKVFEGFIDYLSYLEIAQKHDLSDYLILNSVSLIESALSVLKGGYELVELYLDNDKAGDKGTNELVDILDGIMTYDKRPQYAKYKDVNEYLIKGVIKN